MLGDRGRSVPGGRCAGEGRYHNRRFRRLAEELGLQVEYHDTLGWSLTTLPERTAMVYADAIATLERALTGHREREHRRVAPGSAGSLACVCGCGRRLRVARGVLGRGPILCGVCEQPFTAAA
jgi:hypothetical protein